MFDDLEPKKTTVNNDTLSDHNNLAKKNENLVDDMFSEVESSKQSFNPNQNFPFKNENSLNEIDKQELVESFDNKKDFKRIFLLMFIFLGFLLILFLGYKIFKLAFQDKQDPAQSFLIENNQQEDTSNIEEEKIEDDLIVDDFEKEEKSDIINDVDEEVDKNTDTDGDGVSDWEENIWKTDLGKADTDDDGLSDKDEIYIYRTDPINNDTDKDTYLDGDEVKKGYNPKGEGKLQL